MANNPTSLRDLLMQPLSGDVGIYISNPDMRDAIQTDAHFDHAEIQKITEESIDMTPEEIREGDHIYHEALAYIKDAIAPAMMKITAGDIRVNDTLCKTLYTYAYPDFLESNWLSPLINWDSKCDISIFVYPTDAQKVMKYLKRRLTELQSERGLNQER
jgi:hypothetical protein